MYQVCAQGKIQSKKDVWCSPKEIRINEIINIIEKSNMKLKDWKRLTKPKNFGKTEKILCKRFFVKHWSRHKREDAINKVWSENRNNCRQSRDQNNKHIMDHTRHNNRCNRYILKKIKCQLVQ